MVGVDHYAAESVISVIANFGAELKFNGQIIHSGRSDTMSKQAGGCCAKITNGSVHSSDGKRQSRN
jgi:hypothetical protein